MTLSEVVQARYSARDFLDKPVSNELIQEIISTALRAPSGGNLQPWHIHLVTGQSLKDLKAIMEEVISSNHQEQTEYSVYPPNMPSPYNDRRKQIGEDMYGMLGIPKSDKAARRRWFQQNFAFFGAPMALFFSVDRIMGAPQWADIGMLMQTIMLLLKEQGLDSCAQECWSVYPETLGRFLKLPDERMLFCGMAIGYANTEHPVNQFRSQRASFEDLVSIMN